jgi:hypothetical protein
VQRILIGLPEVKGHTQCSNLEFVARFEIGSAQSHCQAVSQVTIITKQINIEICDIRKLMYYDNYAV